VGGFAAVSRAVAYVEDAVYGENVVRVCLEVLYVSLVYFILV
jgi:hypothetical protein